MIRLLAAFLLTFCLAACTSTAGPLTAQTASGLADDPLLAARSDLGEARSLALDLHLGRPGAAEALEQWLEANSGADALTRSGAWLLLCEERHRRTLYREAIQACEHAESIKPGAAAGFLNFFGALRDVPPMRWDVSSLEVPLIKDSDGTRRMVIDHPAGQVEAVIDSGAEVGVMMASVAQRLGARPVGAAAIATTTSPVVGGMAVVDRLAIGSGHLLNVPFVILPDAQLTFADGTSLPAILPLWTLTSAGRAAFLGNGTRLALGEAVPDMRGDPVPLYWDPSGIGFEARFAKGARAVHLDTGSRRNYLFPTALASLSPAEAASREPFERRIAGIGGEQVEQASRFATIILWVGRQRWVFAPMEMAPVDEEGESARIGAPIMDRFETVVLDFERMRMFVR